MSREYTAVASCGTLASSSPTAFNWADTDIVVDAPFTGLHVSHVAIAGCVLNDTRREAQKRGIAIDGVRVAVRGGFDMQSAVFGDIEYVLEIDSDASEGQVRDLADFVELIAEIPRALADSVKVTRVSS